MNEDLKHLKEYRFDKILRLTFKFNKWSAKTEEKITKALSTLKM
jgi:hypothetical protein